MFVCLVDHYLDDVYGVIVMHECVYVYNNCETLVKSSFGVELRTQSKFPCVLRAGIPSAQCRSY